GTKAERWRIIPIGRRRRLEMNHEFLLDAVAGFERGHGDRWFLQGQFRLNDLAIRLDRPQLQKIGAARDRHLTEAGDAVFIQEPGDAMGIDGERAIWLDGDNFVSQERDRRPAGKMAFRRLANDFEAIPAVRNIELLLLHKARATAAA